MYVFWKKLNQVKHTSFLCHHKSFHEDNNEFYLDNTLHHQTGNSPTHHWPGHNMYTYQGTFVLHPHRFSCPLNNKIHDYYLHLITFSHEPVKAVYSKGSCLRYIQQDFKPKEWIMLSHSPIVALWPLSTPSSVIKFWASHSSRVKLL